jgi:hypothetical protein
MGNRRISREKAQNSQRKKHPTSLAGKVHRSRRTIWTIAVQSGGRNQRQKSEIRNPKQIQIGTDGEMRKTGGREFIREFREFPRILGRGILTADDGDFFAELPTSTFESCNPK